MLLLYIENIAYFYKKVKNLPSVFMDETKSGVQNGNCLEMFF